jgi:hypothetical protein
MQRLTAQQAAAILQTAFAFIRVLGSSSRCLKFMVSRHGFGRRIFFEDFRPLLNIPNRDARENMIQTLSFLTPI